MENRQIEDPHVRMFTYYVWVVVTLGVGTNYV
jgi:hypothetical protein